MGLFSNLFKPASTVLVVDVTALNDSLGMKGNVSPRNQLQTLRSLSRFSRREKLEVVAVASGAPLNKAPHGKKFEGVQVLYSETPEKLSGLLGQTVRQKGAGGVLVLGDAKMEKDVGSSVSILRMSTFRKAFDMGGGEQEPQERTAAPRKARPPRRNRQKAPQSEPRQERPAKEESHTDAINELIDLVD